MIPLNRKTLFFTCFILFAWSVSHAQTNYAVSAIPAHLLVHANAVVRAYDLKFVVEDKGKALETEHMAVTLLNADASWLGEPTFSYYKFEEIKDMEASVFDAEGRLVRNLKKKDIEDRKPLSYFVDDFRFKVLQLPERSYPYTIEYTVVKQYKGLMFYPRFQPQLEPSVSVEHASFEVIMPMGLEARFKEVNLPPGCKAGPNKWALNDLAAFKPVPFSTREGLGMAEIMVAPTVFSFGNMDGDMTSWESLGKFLYALNETQTAISPELQQMLLFMVQDCPDVYCKIQRIYEYLQSNTRYYYVGLGIGGWQPVPASKVDQYKYGDCKGLSNYTASMLNAVGVPAYYALIRAGADEQTTQFPDFPNARFNHAIVCVPMQTDTMWLECTSQTESCGFLSDFTDNRMALVMTPAGGTIMQTPKYDETKNTTHRATQIALEADGKATVTAHIVYTGIAQNTPARLEAAHDEKRKEYLYETLGLGNFEIASLDFKRNKGRLPNVEQNMTLSLPNFAASNGKRLFLPIGLTSRKLAMPPNEADRKSEFQPDARGYTELDSTIISIPSGYVMEGGVDAIDLSTDFGTFENTVTSDGSQLVIYRKLVVNAKRQSAAAFPAFLDFLKTISKTDKAKLVLVKKTTQP